MKRKIDYARQLLPTIALAFIFLCLGLILLLNSVTLGRIQRNSEERTKQITELSRRLDCIALYFSQENRENLTIENIDDCVLKRENGSIYTPAPPSGTLGEPQASSSLTPTEQTINQTVTTPQQPSRPESEPVEQQGVVRKTLNNVVSGVNEFIGGLIR